jgi:hypothetical protein
VLDHVQFYFQSVLLQPMLGNIRDSAEAAYVSFLQGLVNWTELSPNVTEYTVELPSGEQSGNFKFGIGLVTASGSSSGFHEGCMYRASEGRLTSSLQVHLEIMKHWMTVSFV